MTVSNDESNYDNDNRSGIIDVMITKYNINSCATVMIWIMMAGDSNCTDDDSDGDEVDIKNKSCIYFEIH